MRPIINGVLLNDWLLLCFACNTQEEGGVWGCVNEVTRGGGVCLCARREQNELSGKGAKGDLTRELPMALKPKTMERDVTFTTRVHGGSLLVTASTPPTSPFMTQVDPTGCQS
jgi:hypothetical protein